MNSHVSNVNLKFTQQVETESSKCVDSKAYIYVAIDTSGSMSGHKILQVCSSLFEIISNASDNVEFVVRTFSTEVRTLVGKISKKTLDLERLRNGIINSVGSYTALYDAWGQTINDIPYSDFKSGLVHVLIFTDGQNNASNTYSLNTVIDLTNKKIKNKSRFTFIQAGLESSSVGREITAKCSREHCSVINVEDSVDGIRIGFAEAAVRITKHFELCVQIESRNFRDLLAMESNLEKLVLGLASTSTAAASLPGLGPQIAFNNHHNSNLHKALNDRRKPVASAYQNKNVNSPMLSSTAGNRARPASATSSMDSPKNKVWVGNIPLRVTKEHLQTFFAQWGNCSIDTMGTQGKNQWATINYDEHHAGANNAIKYGSSHVFHGSSLLVRPYTPKASS